MNRNQIDKLLVEQKKRRVNLVLCSTGILLLAFAAVFCIFNYIERTRSYQVSYSESSDIAYDVTYIDNEFNDLLEQEQLQGKQYIASLIDKINATFKYQVQLDASNVDYQYAYRIEANTLVKDTTSGKSILDKVDTLVDTVNSYSSNPTLTISQDVVIDYQYYNNAIERLTDYYQLDSVTSTLDINFYVKVLGSCENINNDSASEQVISLSIPLTKRTVGIDLNNNLINSDNKVLICNHSDFIDFLLLMGGIIAAILSIAAIVFTILYASKSRSAEDIYMRELKRIINNYGSYIQEIGSDFKFTGYQSVVIKNFNDMLEIHDTVKQPILMREERIHRKAYFLIPTLSKIIYIYRLNIDDIQRDLHRKRGFTTIKVEESSSSSISITRKKK